MDDMPPELLEHLKALWKMRQPIQLTIKPRDAWTVCAIVQFASRNPMLLPEHCQLMESFGRQIQAAIAHINPALEPYLEMGWHPEYDQEAPQ